MIKTNALVLFVLIALLAAPVAAEREGPEEPPLTGEPFSMVGVLDEITHREGRVILGIGLTGGRAEVLCSLPTLRGADTCGARAERLLGSLVVVRGIDIMAGGELLRRSARSISRVQ